MFKNIVSRVKGFFVTEKKSYLIDWIKYDENTGVYNIFITNPVHIILRNGLTITLYDELSILSADNIHLDSKEIHLNSRNCVQLRDATPETKELWLNLIGKIENIENPKEFNLIELLSTELECIKDDIKNEVTHKEFKKYGLQ
jgi:hypothetical protein